MDSRRRQYTMAFIVSLACSWHSAVSSESCSQVPGKEQPYCVSTSYLPKNGIPSGVIFGLYRDVYPGLHEARFNFNNNAFTEFYNCLKNHILDVCTVHFERTQTPAYTYSANKVEKTRNCHNVVKSSDYWSCFVPLRPETENTIVLTCQMKEAYFQISPCVDPRTCTSVRPRKGNGSGWKAPVKVEWTCSAPPDFLDGCVGKQLKLLYNHNDMNVSFCPADTGCGNGSTIAVTEDCGETPAGADQSEDSSPTPLIIGVVCGLVVIIVLAVLGAFFLRQKMRNKQSSTASMINGTSPNRAALQSALDTNKNNSGAFPAKDAGSNMPSNASKNKRGQMLAYDSFAATSTRDSSTINAYATIADTKCDNGSPLDSSDNRVGNHNDVPAETSQYSSVDGADAAGNAYTKLGEPVRNFKNPYNVLLQPKVDPKARNPIPIPDESTKQPSRYSLAQPILDSGNNRPIEVVDIVHPAHNPDKTSEKRNAEATENKSTNDYDYPSDEDIPVKRKDPMYFELEKEEDIIETATSGGDPDRPYFELEKVEASDADYGLAYPTQDFDPQE